MLISSGRSSRSEPSAIAWLDVRISISAASSPMWPSVTRLARPRAIVQADPSLTTLSAISIYSLGERSADLGEDGEFDGCVVATRVARGIGFQTSCSARRDSTESGEKCRRVTDHGPQETSEPHTCPSGSAPPPDGSRWPIPMDLGVRVVVRSRSSRCFVPLDPIPSGNRTPVRTGPAFSYRISKASIIVIRFSKAGSCWPSGQAFGARSFHCCAL